MPTPNQNLHLPILPPSQRAIWPHLGGIPDSFVLSGGTALALQLGYRDSVDYDFFSDAHFDPVSLFRSIQLFRGGKMTQNQVNTLTVSIPVSGQDDPALVTLLGGQHRNRARPAIPSDNGIAIASTEDVFGCKYMTVYRRKSTKDYRDIAAILERTELTLQDGLEFAKAIYGKKNVDSK